MTWPDPEGMVKDALSAALIADGRVFMFIPENSPTFPLVTVQRVGGGAPGETPVDYALIQIDVWGRTRNKASATTVLGQVLEQVTAWDDVRSSTGRILGGTIQSVVSMDDPVEGRPRYVVTVEVAVIGLDS